MSEWILSQKDLKIICIAHLYCCFYLEIIATFFCCCCGFFGPTWKMVFAVTWKKTKTHRVIERCGNSFSFIKNQHWKATERHSPKEEKNLWGEFLFYIGYSMGKTTKTVRCSSIAILLQAEEENKVFSKWTKDYSRQERTTELFSSGNNIETFTNKIKILTHKSCKRS